MAMDGVTIHRILICRPNTRLGNALLVTPLIREIEQTYPGAQIDILSAAPAAPEVFRGFQNVGCIHLLPYRGARHPLRHLGVLWQVRRIHYDLVIDPYPGSWSSRFTTRLANARIKVGFLSPRKLTGIDISIPFDSAPAHMGAYPVYLFRSALNSADRVAINAPTPNLTLLLTEEERFQGQQKMHQLIPESAGCFIMAVALNATGPKHIGVEWWREMLRALLQQHRVQVVEIIPASGTAFLPEYASNFSTSIRRVASVISAAHGFVSADSGLMHLGAATTTPTVGLFRASPLARYAPYGEGSCGIDVNRHSASFVATAIARQFALKCSSTAAYGT
jgi:ADP-heptose:LPS heptosyltransferase